MKKILKRLTNKVFIVGLIIVAQFLVVMHYAQEFIFSYNIVYISMMLLSMLLVIFVVNKGENPSYSLAWAVVILIFPPLGAVVYLLIGGRKAPILLRESISDFFGEDNLTQDEDILEELESLSDSNRKQAQYIWNTSNYPVFRNRKSEYLATGEKKFKRMLQEIDKAEKFIFLEYFILVAWSFNH